MMLLSFLPLLLSGMFLGCLVVVGQARELGSRHSSLRLDPVQVVLSPGKSSGHANLTSSGGSEGVNFDLGPLVSSSLAANLLHKRAARVPVVRSTASSGVNADNAVTDDSVHGVAVSVGHHGDVPHLSEDGGDASGAVGGLAPSGHGDEGSPM